MNVIKVRENIDFCTKCNKLSPYTIRYGLGVSWNECLGCGRSSDWVFTDDEEE